MLAIGEDDALAELPEGIGAMTLEEVEAATDDDILGEPPVEPAALDAEDPALINRDAEGDGWFFKIRLADTSEPDGLMDETAYREWVKTL